jgi:predicted transcriptional regulator
MSETLVASENIGVSLFVNIVSGTPFTVELCDAGDLAYGVSQEGTNKAPIPGVTGYAAETNESLKVYTIGDVCTVIADATIAAGDLIKPSTDAQAAVCSSADKYSAIALNDAAAGERVKVRLEHGVAP